MSDCYVAPCSSPRSSVLGISQAWILEWDVISFSRESSQPKDWTCISYVFCIGTQVLYHWHQLGSQWNVYRTSTSSNLASMKWYTYFLGTFTQVSIWNTNSQKLHRSHIQEGVYTWYMILQATEGDAKGRVSHWPCSFQFRRSVMSDYLQSHGPQHTRPPCPSPTSRGYSNSCSLSWWCYPTISSSAIPFSCLQSFPASGSFQMSKLFASGGQSIGVSASTSVLPMNIKDWFPLWQTGWISLQSKGLSRVFNTTVKKHQLFTAQLSLWSNSHIHTWLLEKP